MRVGVSARPANGFKSKSLFVHSEWVQVRERHDSFKERVLKLILRKFLTGLSRTVHCVLFRTGAGQILNL
jgi:hypothetical protein